MVQLIVHFRSEYEVTYTENAFHSPSTEVIDQLNNILLAFPDVGIEPLYGGNMTDLPANMRYYYSLSLAQADRARALANLLQRQAFVDAAYVKPPDELP